MCNVLFIRPPIGNLKYFCSDGPVIRALVKVQHFTFLLIAAGESLDRKKVDTAEDNLEKSENNETGDPKHNNDQEKKKSMEKSEANVETYPPFFRESDQGSSKHEQCKTSSIIPEPPSSPSLASLEEDENTPSLGLEDDDWVTYHSCNTLNN